MKPMQGVRVVEVASWTFVPAAGAVLAEWGADVLKIEHPVGGDPQRGLVSMGLVPSGESGANFFIEQPNHSKRSVAINLQSPQGRAVLLKLCEDADVFLTNWLPGARRRAGIDVDDIRAVNPSIVYVRGHGQGARGPDADRGGYDGSAYFARSGVMMSLMGTSEGDDAFGPNQPPAFGDLPGGQTIAGGIAAALFNRARTGEGAVVDVSLLAFGMWANSPAIVNAKLFEGQQVPSFTRDTMPNPLTNRYLTSDGRIIALVMLQAERFWPELVAAVGRPELATDPRFADGAALFENRSEAIAILDEVFAARTLAEWRAALAGVSGVWAVAQNGLELHDDPQAVANGYIAEVAAPSGATFPLVANPVQFDEQAPTLTRAPDHGEHTDEVLLEAGYDMDTIIQLKLDDAIL